MKKLLLSAAVAIATVVGVQAQTTLPVPVSLNFITNIPTVTNFSAATFGLETGAASENSHVDNFIKGDYYFHTNWMFSGEIQNAPVSTVVDSASLYFGYRRVYSNAELYGQFGGRKTFTSFLINQPAWQGGALFGASWFPMDGGKIAITGSCAFWTDAERPVSKAPDWEVRGGLKAVF